MLAPVAASLLFAAGSNASGRYYLLIGVGAYQRQAQRGFEPLSSLYGPDADVAQLKAELDKLGWKPLPGTEGVLYSRADEDEAADRQGLPSKATILAALDRSSLGPDDGFIFAFSGHGATVGDEEYLVPFDGRKRYSDDAWRFETGSSIGFKRDLAPRFAKLKARNRAVLLNMCRETIDISATMSIADRRKMLMSVFDVTDEPSPLLFWSTRPGGFAYASPRKGNPTVFGRFFLDALRARTSVTPGGVSLVRAFQTAAEGILRETQGNPLVYGKGPMSPDWTLRDAEDLFILGDTSTKEAVAPVAPTIATAGNFEGGSVNVFQTLIGHTSEVKSVAFLSDGSTVASGGLDGIIRFWSPTTGTQSQFLTVGEWINDVAFSPDGRDIAAAPHGFDVLAHDWRTHKLNWNWSLLNLAGNQRDLLFPSSVAYSPDGKVLYAGTSGGTLHALHANSGETIRVMPIRRKRPGTKLGSLGIPQIVRDLRPGKTVGAGVPIGEIAASPDNVGIACIEGRNEVEVFNGRTGASKKRLKARMAQLFAIAYSHDGRTVAAAGTGSIERWDAESGKVLPAIPVPGTVKSIAFSPDGSVLVTGASDGSVRIWSSRLGRPVQTLAGHSGAVNSVAFSADGSILATAGEDKVVRLWRPGLHSF